MDWWTGEVKKDGISLSGKVKEQERYGAGIWTEAMERRREPRGHETKGQSPILISINTHLHSISTGLLHVNM